MFYDVIFTPKGKERDFESFTNKVKAKKFAKQRANEGCSEVFLDTYRNEEDMELVNYEVIK